MYNTGSPPHTWRILITLTVILRSLRITSTYVENTTKTLSFARIQWDHLHIRGEYLYHKSNIVMLTGSPPHTWRILPDEFVLFMNTRITSTYVENTKVFRWRVSFDQDHLHIRGEYSGITLIVPKSIGSPPHTWRIPIHKHLFSDGNGITSTYVENTVNKSLYSAK